MLKISADISGEEFLTSSTQTSYNIRDTNPMTLSWESIASFCIKGGSIARIFG